MAGAVLLSIAAACICVWGALCLVFWMGSWQLLYHPKAVVTQTPARAGMAFDSVDFATTESGQPQLHGWWIPAGHRFTAIYLHGADGNIGDTVPDLISLHEDLNLFVLDYRGYGSSAFRRPSEARWREDAEAAIGYLRDTRHIRPGSIVLIGSGLGGNLACEVGALHPELAGVVLEDPLVWPEQAVFGDQRARLVPARWLVRDRWDLPTPAARLNIPSLWFVTTSPRAGTAGDLAPAYDRIRARKTRVWVSNATDHSALVSATVARWLDDLSTNDGISTQ